MPHMTPLDASIWPRLAPEGKGGGTGDPPSATDPNIALTLTDEVRDQMVRTKITCPFLGSAVHQGFLVVRGEANNPLASVEDVRRLGNTGGGDLGDLLVIFASGNHAFMRDDSGTLNKKVPNGLFSLELPGSQGSHPGHSGILEEDPEILGSGRVSETDFARLAKRARNGFIKESDVGQFIAENLAKDPKSKVLAGNVGELLARDLGALVGAIGPALLTKLIGSDEDAMAAHQILEEKLTKLLGEDNLVGSAGEYGLLFAFLVNKPGANEIDGEPALALQDVAGMFLHMRLPAGWETWKKHRIDWAKYTARLLLSAFREYNAIKRNTS
jgi:hypothetical protein